MLCHRVPAPSWQEPGFLVCLQGFMPRLLDGIASCCGPRIVLLSAEVSTSCWSQGILLLVLKVGLVPWAVMLLVCTGVTLVA